MADEELNPKMRFNPIWYQGWEFVEGSGIFEITEDLDMKGFGIKNVKDPVEEQDVVTKKYVDEAIANIQGGGGGGGGPSGPITAAMVSYSPSNQIQGANVQLAIDEIANEGAFVDKANTFTQPQTIAGTTIKEEISTVPYGFYAPRSGKSTVLETQNSIDIKAHDLLFNGRPIGAGRIEYTPKANGLITGSTVQEALESADDTIKAVQSAQGNYVEKSGLTADLSAGGFSITELKDGATAKEAVNKGQLDLKADASEMATAKQDIGTLKQNASTYVTKTGGVLTGALDAGRQQIKNLAGPSEEYDATTRKYVDDALKQVQGALQGQLQWAGTYDCAASEIVSLSDVGGRVPDFVVKQNLPVITQANGATLKNHYFIATNKNPAMGAEPAPQKPLSAGDWIIADTNGWQAIEMAKAVTAATVSFVPAGTIQSTDVQKAVEEVSGDVTALETKVGGLETEVNNITQGTTKIEARNVLYSAKNPDGVIPGATIQDAMHNADGVISSVKATVGGHTTKIAELDAAKGSYAVKTASNIFTQANTFALVPTTDANNDDTNDKQLANLAYVKSSIRKIKAGDITVDPELVNLTGTNVQDVLGKVNQAVGYLNDYMVGNSSLVGTYDASNNRVLTAFGAGVGKLTVGQPLPTPDDNCKSFLLFVKVAGAGVTPAPAEDLKSGDMIRCTGTLWERVQSAPVLTATDIAVTTLNGIVATNAQEALAGINARIANIKAIQVAVDTINDLVGTNVQEVLTTASTKIKTNEGNIRELDEKVQTLDATKVAFDNSQSNLPGSDVTTVQKAIDATRTLIQTNISSVNARNVIFSSQQGIRADNVEGALDELKTDARGFVTKRDGVLENALDANTQVIKNLGAPTAAGDATSKSYVEANFIQRDGGQLLGDLDANSRAITNVKDAINDKDAANKYYVDNAIVDAGTNYVTKTGGQLAGDLNANNQKITGLANPGSPTDAANQQYVDAKVQADIGALDQVYVKKTGGVLTGQLDAGTFKIVNLGAPGADGDAARKLYVDNQLNTLRNSVLPKVGAVLGGNLNANSKYIANVADAASPGDAVNQRVLDRTIRGLQSQLVGKLTFCGTYNASSNRVAMVSNAGGTLGFTVGEVLPADAANRANCFLIVSVAGNGTGAAPAKRLGVGDIILAQGGAGWLDIPIGSTRTADNVAITPIQALANTTNVQEALEALASRPTGGGASTAVQVAFTPAGEIEATNVQTALQEVDSETVKLAGNQTIQGNKTFASFTKFEGHSSGAIHIGATWDQMSFVVWKSGNNNRAWMGFVSTLSANENIFQFHVHSDGSAAQPTKFQFTRIMEYSSASILPTSDQQIPSKRYVDQQITDAGSNYVSKTGGSLTGPLNANGQAIQGLPQPSADNDAVRKAYVDTTFVKRTGGQLLGDLDANNKKITGLANPDGPTHAISKQFAWDNFVTTTDTSPQNVRGRKRIMDGLDFKSGEGVAFNVDPGRVAYFQWWNAGGTSRYAYFGYGTTNDPNNFQFWNDANVTTGNAQPAKFTFNRIIQYTNANIQPTDDKHLVTKKYVDDRVAANAGSAGGVSVVSASNVNVTANFPGLNGKGTALYSHRLLKNDADGSILSAIFGLKLTLTGAWTPTASSAPVQFVDDAHIPGLQYYQGLPIPPDTSLGGNYKTVAQVHLYRTVTTNGISLIQNDTPIKLGRIVCLNDTAGQGKTKLYLVVSYNQAIPVPQGTGAFYTMRYEGLPTMPIV